MRIKGSTLKAFKETAKARPFPTSVESSESADNFLQQIQPADKFTRKWPGPDGEEDFENALECVAHYRGREHHLKVGFAIKPVAGKDCLRALVLDASAFGF